jgi:hypothetical protein
VHDYEACRGNSSVDLQGQWEKIVVLSLMHEIMGRRERSIWSQERMA